MNINNDRNNIIYIFMLFGVNVNVNIEKGRRNEEK